jgi:hypothetical protein
MAFSADELRVLRRALAEALHHAPFPPAVRRTAPVVPAPSHEPVAAVEYLRLAETLDEAVRESARLRLFRLADLTRYRDALPGTAAGYLDRLGDALDGGHHPAPEDIAALRTLTGLPCGPAESHRRTALLRRCEDLTRYAHDGRDAQGGGRRGSDRARLLALPGGRVPAAAPAATAPGGTESPPRPPQGPDPDRRVPTPAELWPPRHREPPRGPERRATG